MAAGTPVLYVHHHPRLGGSTTSLALLIRHLSDGFEPHVLAPRGPAGDALAAGGAVVHRAPAANFVHTWDATYRGARWLVLGRELAGLGPHALALARLLRGGRFPIVHLNDSTALPAAGIAHAAGAKVVVHLRSSLAGGTRAGAIVALLDRWADAAIAIDADVAASFPLRVEPTVVHNPVEAHEERPAELGMPAGRVKVLFAGFLRRPKGWPELVEAAAALVRSGDPVQFVVLGGGVRPPAWFRTAGGRLSSSLGLVRDEESAMRALVSEHGLDDRFTFLPFTADTGPVYAAVDVVAFPNQGAGLGRPVLEAAAHGKPALASGSPSGAGVLLPEQTGILVPKPSPAALAEALRRLVRDPELRAAMGTAAAEHARRAFDPLTTARRVEEVYARLLAAE